MKLKLYTFLLALIALGTSSCKTAKKMYEKGNYDEAVELAAKKLQKDPGNPELLSLLRDAYRYAVNDHEDRIRSYSESQNELKWEWMYNSYAALQRMYDAIYKAPSVFDAVQPVNYNSYLVTYAQKAGNVRYERGIAFMQRYDKQSYRNAYREFQAALRFIPGDRDALVKMNEALEYAVTNVVILPIQQQGGYVYSTYRVGGNNFDDQLVRDLQSHSGSEFVKFYPAWDARSRAIRTDFEVSLQLARVSIGREDDYRTQRKVSKEIVIKERIIRPDSVVREYGWVHATIHHTRRTRTSELVLQLNIRDHNGRWLGSEDIPANHAWSTEFASFTGDVRALTEPDLQLTGRRRDIPPSENEIMGYLLDKVSNDATWKIRSQFSRY